MWGRPPLRQAQGRLSGRPLSVARRGASFTKRSCRNTLTVAEFRLVKHLYSHRKTAGETYICRHCSCAELPIYRHVGSSELDQPRSGERMQPTAQAVGKRAGRNQAPEGRQKVNSSSQPCGDVQVEVPSKSFLPLRGSLEISSSHPRHAPWAAFLRRFAASLVGVCSTFNPRCIFRRTPHSSSGTRRTLPGTYVSDDALLVWQYIS